MSINQFLIYYVCIGLVFVILEFVLIYLTGYKKCFESFNKLGVFGKIISIFILIFIWPYTLFLMIITTVKTILMNICIKKSQQYVETHDEEETE